MIMFRWFTRFASLFYVIILPFSSLAPQMILHRLFLAFDTILSISFSTWTYVGIVLSPLLLTQSLHNTLPLVVE